MNYEKQNWKKSKVFFKIMHWPERTISKHASQPLISKCSVNVRISFSVNIFSHLRVNSDLMALFASHLCLNFTIIWVLEVFCYCVRQKSSWNAQTFTEIILHVVQNFLFRFCAGLNYINHTETKRLTYAAKQQSVNCRWVISETNSLQVMCRPRANLLMVFLCNLKLFNLRFS